MGCWCTKVRLNIYGLLDEQQTIYMTFFNADDILATPAELNIFIGDIDEVGVDGRIQFFSSPYSSPYPSPPSSPTRSYQETC